MEAKQNNKPFRQLRKVVMITHSHRSFPLWAFLVKVFFIKEKKSSYTIYTCCFFYTEVNVSWVPGFRMHGKQREDHGSERFPEFPSSSPGVGVTGVGWGWGGWGWGRVRAGAAGAETWRRCVRIHNAGLLRWNTHTHTHKHKRVLLLTWVGKCSNMLVNIGNKVYFLQGKVIKNK